MADPTDPADLTRLLQAYDAQLRLDAETNDAEEVTRIGPLAVATMRGGRGFVTYRDLGGADAAGVRNLVAATVEHLRADASITHAEWKTRGHDHAPGLHEALLEHGFVPDEPESIMVGEAALLALDLPVPEGVVLRRVTEPDDLLRMAVMQGEVFGDPPSQDPGGDLARRLERSPAMELWIAEADGEVVCAGRLDPVDGSDFAGIWGGATVPAWRGRGIYRALTAARARSALRIGKTLLHSDSTEFSRPILERSGLLKVSTTTPYEWRREPV